MSQINVGYDNYSAQAIDRSYGDLFQGSTIPYNSVAEANLAVNPAYRHRGKTVLINDAGFPREYWWRINTQDVSLVPKVTQEQIIDFVVGDGQATTPVAGTNVFPNPASGFQGLKNCVITEFSVEGASRPPFVRALLAYFTYDSNGGTITTNNENFSGATWYRIKFRQL